MFTGIIEQTGTLVGLTDRGGVRRITVEAPGIASRLREGDSLGVSGVCLTALDPDPTYFYADLAQETLDRTSLGSLHPGAKVNLELPTAAGSPLGGPRLLRPLHVPRTDRSALLSARLWHDSALARQALLRLSDADERARAPRYVDP